MTDYQEQQPTGEKKPAICNETGIQIFQKPEDLIIHEFGEIKYVDHRLSIPSIGEVQIILANRLSFEEWLRLYANSVYVLDGNSPYSVQQGTTVPEKGLSGIRIVLNEVLTHHSYPMQVGIWIKGKSQKFLANLEYGKSDFPLTKDGDGTKVAKMTYNWRPIDSTKEKGLYVPVNFDLLKNTQISISGIVPKGRDVN